MPELEIAVVLGSTRPGRNGKAVADWVVEKAASRTAAQYQLIDLADHPLPHIDEAAPPSMGQYAGEHTKAWAEAIGAFDGFVFRAIEHLRGIASELQIAHVRQQLSFSLFTDFENFSSFAPGPQHADAAVVLFDQLESWTRAMKTIRDQS